MNTKIGLYTLLIALAICLSFLEGYANTPKKTVVGFTYISIKNKEYQKELDYLKKLNEIYLSHVKYLERSEKNNSVRDIESKYPIEVKNKSKQKHILNENMQNGNQLIPIISIILLTLITVFFYVLFQNLKLKQKNNLKNIQRNTQLNIINATLDGQENERKKIASFLHDNISAQLSSAGLHLSAFLAITNIKSEEIDKTIVILKDTHDKVRDLSHRLIPSLLTQFGLFYVLHDLCEKNSNSLITFEFSSNLFKKNRYNPEYEMKVYFILTELFNNVLKHAHAKNVKLNIEEIDQNLHISVEDNGKGFLINKSESYEGFGLTQIRARVISMNGKFSISSKLNKGTLVLMKLPVQEKN